MTLTDTLSSPQSVLRQSRHIARLEKDCYFLGLAQNGCVTIRQANSSMTMHAGVGALYCASEPYALRCDIKLRSFWAELPRQAFASRFDSEAPPLIARLNLSHGLGRIAVEFCAAMALEGGRSGSAIPSQARRAIHGYRRSGDRRGSWPPVRDGD
jgi:hypothetical protein